MNEYQIYLNNKVNEYHELYELRKNCPITNLVFTKCPFLWISFLLRNIPT